jgi:signal transduction histidine kinase
VDPTSPYLSLNDQWARRLARYPVASAAVAGLCLLALVLLLVGDGATQVGTTFGGLQIVPLLVAGWLLAPRVAVTLTLAAVALRLAAVADGSVAPITGGIQAFVALVAGVLTIAASDRALARALIARRSRGVRRLTRLLDAIRALGTESEPDASVEEILAAAVSLFTPQGAVPPHAMLAVVEGDTLRATHVGNGSGSLSPLDGALTPLPTPLPIRDNPPIQRALEDGGTVVVRPGGLRGEARRLAASAGTRTTVLARVRAAGRPYGLLAVSFPYERPFDPEELRLLEAMGHLCGIAIDSAGAVRLERSHSERMRQHAERSAELEGMKREFLLLASHELRSPLAVARGYATMLRDGSLGRAPEAYERPLEVLGSKLDEIGSLVDDMLETARLETGNLRLARGDVDLRELVASAVDVVRPAVGEQHQLEVELPGKPVVVRGDSERLRRIAVNLLDNAVKYSPDGGPVQLEVTARRSQAVVRVRDRGVGIPEDAMGNMFKRFGRIVTPRTSNIPGTGLGLYLCRELARAHDGDLTVESTEGEGSTFTLTLPLRRGEES